MKIKVKNRSSGLVCFSIPEMHIRKEFSPNEIKEVESEELERLAYQPGGQELLDRYFIIMDKDLAKKVSPSVALEPEYSYSDEDIKDILVNGSLDEFLDFLDFAPEGAIDIVKKMAVSFATDTNKINAIYKKTGFNVLRAQELSKEEEPQQKTETRARRVTAEPEVTAPKKPTYQRV